MAVYPVRGSIARLSLSFINRIYLSDTMKKIICNCDGTAALETAVVLPLFVVLTFGITDVGGGVFTRMSVNAASQAGASYAVSHYADTSPPISLAAIQTAMNQAAGSSSFCSPPTGSCTASVPSQCPPTPCVVTVTASHSWTPILPTRTYSWAIPIGITYTTTIRVS